MITWEFTSFSPQRITAFSLMLFLQLMSFAKCSGQGVLNNSPGNNTSNGTVGVSLKLRKQLVVLGEPVLVDCTFINQRNEDIEFYELSANNVRTFATLALKTQQGTVVFSERVNNKALNSGGYRLSRGLVAPGKTRSQAFVVPYRITPTAPGNHLLHVSINLPYSLGRTGRKRVQKSEVDLALTVVSGSEKELRTLAQNLGRDSAKPDSEGVLAVRSLMQMPEKIAGPQWNSIAAANSPYSSRLQAFVDELCLRGDSLAVTLLSRMWETTEYTGPNPNDMGAKGNMAKESLTFLYPRSNSSLKARIKDIFLSHNLHSEAAALPESVDKEIRPQSID